MLGYLEAIFLVCYCIVCEVRVGHNRLHGVPPDSVCDEVNLAVTHHLLHHLPAGDLVVASV